MDEIKATKTKHSYRIFLIAGTIGLVVAAGLLIEARALAVNYPVVWSVSKMSYWYWVAHYAGLSILAISLVLVIAYVAVVFFSEENEATI